MKEKKNRESNKSQTFVFGASRATSAAAAAAAFTALFSSIKLMVELTISSAKMLTKSW